MHKKRSEIYIMILSIVLLLAFANTALAAPMTITVDGEQLISDVAPIIKDNRVLVPMRVICEKLDATVNYDGASQTVSVYKEGISLILYLGRTKAVINGTEKLLDVPPDIVNNRTMLPLRFLSESLQCQVNWLKESNSVSVLTGKAPVNPPVIPPVTEPPVTSEVKPPVPSIVLPEATNVGKELFDIINTNREKLGLQPILRIDPLNGMAKLIICENAAKGVLSHVSGQFGDLNARTEAAGMSCINELLSADSFDAASIWDEWISRPEYKELLYSKEIYFGGVYACYAADGNSLYVALELAWGNGLFISGSRDIKSASAIRVQGYAYADDTVITVYELSAADTTQYLSRKAYNITLQADHSFTMTLPMDKAGLYAVYLGNDRISVQY